MKRMLFWAIIKRLCIGLLMLLVTAPLASALDKQEQTRLFEKKLRGMIEKKVLPIIDVEFHHGGKVEIEKLIDRMDDNGVALIWLGPNEKLGSMESVRMNEQFPDRFVPVTMHGDGPRWHSSDKGFLDDLTRDARSGKYYAMGEFEARHYPSSTNNRDVHMPVDSESMQVVFGLSAETGLPFLLHHEAEDGLLPELERMLVKYPKAKVIWCHIGRNRNPGTWKKFRRADAARDYLKKYPNLYFDFLASKPGSKYHGTGQVEGVMYEISSYGVEIDPEWKKVIEEFPDRFVLGSDINTGRFENFDRVIDTYRNIILKGLRPDVAEKIAYKNAWKLMTGEEWKSPAR